MNELAWFRCIGRLLPPFPWNCGRQPKGLRFCEEFSFALFLSYLRKCGENPLAGSMKRNCKLKLPRGC